MQETRSLKGVTGKAVGYHGSLRPSAARYCLHNHTKYTCTTASSHHLMQGVLACLPRKGLKECSLDICPGIVPE
eukprot:1152615-Pelagomonas_calceolata.AAC.8